jgi:hypothetical protein
MKTKELLIIGICMASGLLMSACSSTASFIAQNHDYVATPKSTDKVDVFFSESDVPYAHKGIGKIFVNMVHNHTGDESDQLVLIKEKCAEVGCDGVIIEKVKRSHGSAAAYGYVAAAESEEFDEYSGIAIVKITPVSNQQATSEMDLEKFFKGLKIGTPITLTYLTGQEETIVFQVYDEERKAFWIKPTNEGVYSSKQISLKDISDVRLAVQKN